MGIPPLCIGLITMEWNGRPAEVVREALGIAHNFHHIGVEVVFSTGQWVCRGAHARGWCTGQNVGHGINQCRVNQRLITLHVDHHVITVQTQFFAGLSQAITATGVVCTGEYGIYAMGLAGLEDGLAICCYHHACSSAFARLQRHAHDHGQARDISQGFVGQAAGGQTCGNEYGECHGNQPSSSLSSRGRASFSSKMGMPSRTG